MKTGDIVNGKYRVERLLGKGGNGYVYLCTNLRLGNKWALKHIPAGEGSRRHLPEVEILRKLYHVSLPRIVDVFRDERGLYIVESNMEGTDLESMLRRRGSFGIDTVVDWALELCDILEYLHDFKPRPIIYRDLKPSNIMLTRGNRLVLVDFGISKEYCSGEKRDTCAAGTASYAAPEQLIRGGLTDGRTDIYNLGATIYRLLYGKVPGQEDNRLTNRKNRALSGMDRIISRCMESRPEDRYQEIDAVRLDLLSVKNMLAVGRRGRDILYKLEAAMIILLSAVTYIIALRGMASLMP